VNITVGLCGTLKRPCLPLQMWSSLIAKAKAGGLDVIDTYVFWNLHEPQLGQVSLSLCVSHMLMPMNRIKISSLSPSLYILYIFFLFGSLISVEDMTLLGSLRKSKHKAYICALELDPSLKLNGITGKRC
jgi:hypothetical protein